MHALHNILTRPLASAGVGGWVVVALWLGVVEPSYAVDFRDYPTLVRLVDTMERKDNYPRQELVRILDDAIIDQDVIRLITHPSEDLPWYKYRKLLVSPRRIKDGLVWWKMHRQTLQKAAKKYGVPPEIIVALIGVETNFGRIKGKRRVLDSLVTLTAAYPRRSAYFGRELRVFLNTTRAENIAANSITGSYAGAMGIPQFMPSSYQSYAVDFNQNRRRDLHNEVEDAIGSVANYLKKHGWKRDQKIFAEIPKGVPSGALKWVNKKNKPTLKPAQLTKAGLKFDPRGGSSQVALFGFQELEKMRYIVGFNNFYVITRYNTSRNYALAVTELSYRLRAQINP